jgi:hypothetical protein
MFKFFVDNIGTITLGLAALVLTLIAAMIILMMYRCAHDSRAFNFLYETSADGKTGKPSVSRLQMLIWNFVVAFAFLYVLGKMGASEGTIKALLQPEVLVLLGISNSTYLLGKRTRQGSADAKPPEPSVAADASGGQPLVGDGEGPGPQGTP